MKTFTAMCLVLVLILSMVGCSGEEKKIEFPFAVSDVENIEMYSYNPSVSFDIVSPEKKIVTETTDIETLYNLFAGLSLSTEETEQLTGADVYSFRFNLTDGKDYELFYVVNGVKNGVVGSPTENFEYFTFADIDSYWSGLNYEVIAADTGELPGYSAEK